MKLAWKKSVDFYAEIVISHFLKILADALKSVSWANKLKNANPFFVFEMLAYICTSCSVHRETHGYPRGVSKYRLPFLLISIRVGQPRKIMLLFIFFTKPVFSCQTATSCHVLENAIDKPFTHCWQEKRQTWVDFSCMRSLRS